MNHFLHQLEPQALQELGAALQGARVVLACETLRRPWALALCRLSRLIGFSRAGIHDGVLSLKAGFRAQELPQLLGFAASDWQCECKEGFPGWYRMCASRWQS